MAAMSSAELFRSCERAILSPLSYVSWSKAPEGTNSLLVLGAKAKSKSNSGHVIQPSGDKYVSKNQRGVLGPSSYAQYRDATGSWFKGQDQNEDLMVEFVGCSKEERLGAMVGLAIASYSYKFTRSKDKVTAKLYFKSSSASLKKEVTQARAIGESINLSRHLVNLSPQDLNPKSYADLVKKWFSGNSKVKVDVWNTARLKKEKMNMIVAVGQAAEHQSQMVHIHYGSKPRPLVFVGKGITFDSGGLDIKPPSNMRLMKKDMGGSAAVVGLAHLTVQLKSKQSCDFYLALAENAVSANSFHPSDVITAKNGLDVEIDNTDAEGRLVMGDTLVVASRQKQKPKAIIDVATLTGAVNVALGANVAGLFSNNDSLADKIEKLGSQWGDPVWRLPLYQNYRKDLESPFAHMRNSGGRFGGGITAALFLESFVEDCHWAHLDIYGWQGGSGPYSEHGGSGQAVQTLMGLVL